MSMGYSQKSSFWPLSVIEVRVFCVVFAAMIFNTKCRERRAIAIVAVAHEIVYLIKKRPAILCIDYSDMGSERDKKDLSLN